MTQPDHPDWVGLSTELGVFTTLFSGTVAHGTASPAIPVQGYKSVTITAGSVLPVLGVLNVVDTNTLQILATLTSLPGATSNSIGPITLPLNSGSINIVNSAGIDSQVTVRGSNRDPIGRASSPATLGVDSLTYTGAPVASGATIIGAGGGQGPAYSWFLITGTTIKGIFEIICGGVAMPICDDTQFHSNGAADRYFYLNWVAPINPWQLQFQCLASGAGTVAAFSVYQ